MNDVTDSGGGAGGYGSGGDGFGDCINIIGTVTAIEASV